MVNVLMRKSKRKGFTLITALAFSLVVGTVLAGVGTVAMSHLGRSKVEGDYSDAIAMADAGVNYEIRSISLDPVNLTGAHQISTGGFTPSTPPIPGVNGTFTVGVRAWDGPNHNCDGGDWTNPLQDVCFVATGTVNGISRTIRVRGKDKSVFDEFAIYALDNGKFSGAGSGSGSTTIVGDMGTNGTLSFNGTKGTGTDQGTVYFNGSGSSLSSGSDAGNTVQNPDPVIFPTVSDWANKLFPGGLTYLQTNNSNANIKQLLSTDKSLASEPTVAGLTLADVNSKLGSAGFTAASRTFGDPSNSTPADTSPLDLPSASNPRFVQSATPYASAYGINGLKTYFIPPGDYYFTRLNFKAGNTALVFLTHLGPIHIWVDNTSNLQDSLNTVAVFTDTNPTKFRVFYNKCSTMNIAGSSVFPGGFYAVNPVCDQSKSTSGTPSLDFGGNVEVLGSIIGDYLTLGGATSIVFPNNAGGDPTDFALWFGFKDNWKELPVNNGSNPVFADGTSN